MQALSISKELTDVRAERAVLRLLARGYRAVGPLPESFLYAFQCEILHYWGNRSANRRPKHMPGCYIRQNQGTALGQYPTADCPLSLRMMTWGSRAGPQDCMGAAGWEAAEQPGCTAEEPGAVLRSGGHQRGCGRAGSHWGHLH